MGDLLREHLVSMQLYSMTLSSPKFAVEDFRDRRPLTRAIICAQAAVRDAKAGGRGAIALSFGVLGPRSLGELPMPSKCAADDERSRELVRAGLVAGKDEDGRRVRLEATGRERGSFRKAASDESNRWRNLALSS